MRSITPWFIGGLMVMAFGFAAAQTPVASAPLIRHTFDSSEQGWAAMGNTAKVSITQDAANVRIGTGSLRT